MANPAQLLLNQLQTWNQPNRSADQARATNGAEVWILHRLAVRHVDALEEILREMASKGKDVAVWEGAFAIWSQAVFAWPHGWRGQNTGGIDPTTLAHLQTFASWLDDYLPKADEHGLERTGKLVDDILDAVNADESLPADMKIHLRQMCDQLRWCLDRYSQAGDFVLKVAIDRLLITVGQYAQQSPSSTFRDKVTTIVNTFVYPFIVGTLAQVTGGAILSVLGLDGGGGPTALPPGGVGPALPPGGGGGGGGGGGSS
jgi:hypothetical protein